MQVDWTDGKTGFLTAGGKSLEYACFGPAPDQAPTIVMLHEGLGCLALWRDFPQRVAAATGCGVFVYSRAGYGQSDLADLPRPLDYMTREAVDVLPQVLDGFGFQNGILMGHSDGATIAAIYAGSVEDFRVRGLILMAPHFFTEDMGLAEISKAKTVFETGELKQKMAKYHRDPENTFRGWNDSWLAPGFKSWNVGEVIDYLRIPVLAIQGRQDQYGTLAQIDEIDSRIYSPLETAILDDCGHSPHFDQPKQTLAAITDFTARLIRIERESVEIT
ncbi:acetoin dehydrogenase E2 subunit dihydrolipoyllysine-residue acetyltransferase [Thalassovita gelatinovora]|uniref:Acetoin dehydrogenase E2 subunit dihydrolipoyllysine-residue acetyltransferase n=1 Tax=Thalassovita gelatinovora TaxID=53501 RepID=A0A0P1FXB9_THAGE|nr:alpha/beta hydrolase [Thalassovita gelatinovora]QIZ80201.1 alpha/beta hydrolase [Thalassovita gelatinovora]CUH64035.1 acetoin dehydrogenase E2 subunit dihydrolipoyllysine-residue acetyltransferase [Thalassovita gelatinovora]SEQ82025.1 Pimeloyl-ACP methyl ester carboxylesterase [Thalassovita gelatinovora]